MVAAAASTIYLRLSRSVDVNVDRWCHVHGLSVQPGATSSTNCVQVAEAGREDVRVLWGQRIGGLLGLAAIRATDHNQPSNE
jgi:hypothetical protein